MSDSASNTYVGGNDGITGHAIYHDEGNIAATTGAAAMAYSYNCAALTSGQTITMTNATGASNTAALSCFYATGLKTASDPQDSTTNNGTGGSSATPSVTASGAPATASSLVIGLVGTNGPSGDSFTQDSTNAAYATPPTRVGTAGGNQTTNYTIAGGFVVTSSQLTYAPSITSRNWAAMIAGFAPAPSGSTVHPSTLPLLGAGMLYRALKTNPVLSRRFWRLRRRKIGAVVYEDDNIVWRLVFPLEDENDAAVLADPQWVTMAADPGRKARLIMLDRDRPDWSRVAGICPSIAGFANDNIAAFRTGTDG